MGTTVSPYLTFNNSCREAMTFYKDIFGGELTIDTVAETPDPGQCHNGLPGQVMHSMLVNNAFVLMGTDMQGPAGFIAGTDIALCLNFDSEQEINRCYTALSEGGNVIDSLKDSFWGSIFGMVQDKFGKVWMLNFEKKGTPQGN